VRHAPHMPAPRNATRDTLRPSQRATHAPTPAPHAIQALPPQAPAFYTVATTDRRSNQVRCPQLLAKAASSAGARSSVDRALASGARGRKFESCRARAKSSVLAGDRDQAELLSEAARPAVRAAVCQFLPIPASTSGADLATRVSARIGLGTHVQPPSCRLSSVVVFGRRPNRRLLFRERQGKDRPTRYLTRWTSPCRLARVRRLAALR
jgi:hypothetical protein